MFRKIILAVSLLTGLILTGFGSPDPFRIDTASKPFVNSRFINIDGAILHYRQWLPDFTHDSLPWILMVHGMGGSTFSWEYNAPALTAAGFNVIAVDVPPFGYSDKNPNTNQSVDRRAGLLWEFLNRIRPGSTWHLAGHSMGGGIVQCMAIINPSQVDKVVFVAPALFSNLSDQNVHRSSILRFRPFEWIAVGIGNAAMIKPRKIEKMLKSAYAQDPDQVDVAEYYKALSQRGFARAVIRSASKSEPENPVDGKKFNKPAIAIWGDQDTWVPLNKSQPLLDRIPSIQVVMMEGAGHCPMATHPGPFNQQMIHFLSNTHNLQPAT